MKIHGGLSKHHHQGIAILLCCGSWILRLAHATPTKTIAVVEFMQETNSFSPVFTTRKEFESTLLLYGPDDILNHCHTQEPQGHVTGFWQAVQDSAKEVGDPIRVVPILQARSVSGGPIERSVYDDLENTIVEGIQTMVDDEETTLEGIYLSLHGAMGVAGGLRDPEGHLLRRIRNVVGNDLPIGVTHDLHANLTKRRMDLMTFLVGYRTNPHRDFYQVGYKAGEILVNTIRGTVRPVMAYRKMRLLKGGGMNIDLLHPMRKVFSWMSAQEKSHPNKILWLSTFMVHLWLDDPELGWTTVAVTDNDPDLAEQLADELAEHNWQVRHEPLPEGHSPSQAIAMAQQHWILRKLGAVVFCDVSDAVGAGAPGESTWILQALLDHASSQHQNHNGGTGSSSYLTSYITIRDADAVQLAFDTGELGENMTMMVGGKLDLLTNTPVMFTGKLIQKSNADKKDGSRTVILRHEQGIHLILNEVPSPLHGPEYFTNLGLSLWDADIVVVKNLFPFRYRYLLYNRKTVNVITPGVTNIDVFSLNYTHIPRPIYPLDDIETWRMNIATETEKEGPAARAQITSEIPTTIDGEEL